MGRVKACILPVERRVPISSLRTLLTFEKVVPNCKLVGSLGFLLKGAQVKAVKLACVIYFSVFKFALKLEEYHFCLLCTLLCCDWNGLD